MKRQALLLALGCLLWNGPATADETLRQTRVSVTLSVPSLDHAANDLRSVGEAFDAQLENLNLDAASGTGNATFKVPRSQVAEVMTRLAKVGKIANQSQSTSDYTTSVEQYERKAKAYRALSEVDTRVLLAKLPPDQRGEVSTEFQSWVSNGLQSNESSAKSYRDMTRVTEISIQLTGKPVAPPPSQVTPTPNQVTVPPPNQVTPTPTAPDSRPMYLLCLLNFLGLWVIYRRVDRPEAPSPHTH